MYCVAIVLQRKLFPVLLILAMLLPISLRSQAQARSHLIFEDTFNSGSFQPYNEGLGWEQTEFTDQSKGEIVSQPTRAGAGAAKFTLQYPDIRAEKNKFSAGNPGTQRWFGFSLYIPETWQDHDNFTIVAQVKSMPDTEEPHRSPFLSFEIRNGILTIYSRWDSNPISKPEANGNGGTIESKLVYSGSYTKGKWTDWVIHAKWSYNDDGLLEIWNSGTKLGSWIGPNCYNDTEHPFHFKLGMYKPGYKSTDPSALVIYHDEVRIGDENASYADVAPS